MPMEYEWQRYSAVSHTVTRVRNQLRKNKVFQKKLEFINSQIKM